jgi:two-component system response regulator NreC
MSLRILLADDHVVVRQGVKNLLTGEGYNVVGEAADGREAVRLAQVLQPDIAVLDLSMPLLNGLGAAREILKVSRRTKPILLTLHREAPLVSEAIRIGIKAYVVKAQAAADLFEAIREVSRGETYVSPNLLVLGVARRELAAASLSPDPLTRREREILQLVAEGKSTKEIADLLGISFNTVESHRTRLMAKLNIHERAGLVRYAIRRGVIEP